MKKAKLYAVALAALIISSVSANAQSIVDPGISVYNYKHPNKAALAKKKGNEQTVVQVANVGTIERAGKYQRRAVSTTPKYAPRANSLVVYRNYKVEGIEINPLTSPRHYKTPNPTAPARDTAQLADYYQNSVYPTTD